MIFCVLFLPLPSMEWTSIFSISSLRSAGVNVSICKNLRTANVNCSLLVRRFSISESSSWYCLIFTFSSSRSASYFWESYIKLSSLTTPLICFSKSFLYSTATSLVLAVALSMLLSRNFCWLSILYGFHPFLYCIFWICKKACSVEHAFSTSFYFSFTTLNLSNMPPT